MGFPYNPSKYTDTAANFGVNSTASSDGRSNNNVYQARRWLRGAARRATRAHARHLRAAQTYTSRFPHGAIGAANLGDVYSALWYAQVVGPVQLIVL